MYSMTKENGVMVHHSRSTARATGALAAARVESDPPGRHNIYTNKLPMFHGWFVGVQCVFILYKALEYQ